MVGNSCLREDLRFWTYISESVPACSDILCAGQYDNHRGNRSFPIHKDIVVSIQVSKYDDPSTFGELLRRYRLENDLFAKELASLIGVTEDTILNWEKDRMLPCQKHILLLKEQLSIDPFELVKYGAISERQKSIINLITERGSITGAECQELLGLRQQYAQNDLFFLYKLGVLDRTLGVRKKAAYFLAGDKEG